MRLEPVATIAARDALLAGELGGLEAAPGWPHSDTESGLRFLDWRGQVFLVLDDDHRICGECGTKTPPDERGMVEIGYGLAGPSRNRGIGSAAVADLVSRLWAQPSVLSIEAEIHSSNLPSQRVVERLGFTVVGREVNGYHRYRLGRLR